MGVENKKNGNGEMVSLLPFGVGYCRGGVWQSPFGGVLRGCARGIS